MNQDQFNAFCGALKASTHIVQWGGSHVWKIGGKVYAIGRFSSKLAGITFKASDFSYEILRDAPGYRPAPYLASRGMKWIQCHEAPQLGGDELKQYLRDSHRMIADKLPKRLQRELGLDRA